MYKIGNANDAYMAISVLDAPSSTCHYMKRGKLFYMNDASDEKAVREYFADKERSLNLFVQNLIHASSSMMHDSN